MRSPTRENTPSTSGASQPMITTSELETFSLVIDRQEAGSSENDIRFAFQTFIIAAGLAKADEMSTEAP